MSGLTIQIREEEKSFAKSHLAEVLNVAPSTISRWIKKGKLPQPSGDNGKFSRSDLEAIFERFRYVPVPEIRNRSVKRYWNELKKSSFMIVSDGIFNAVPFEKHFQNKYLDWIKKYGLWETQGGNNFERMEDYVRNPILQLILAKELIDYWIRKIRELNPKQKIIIYWNGSVNSVVCIYLMPEENEEFLKEFDKRLRKRKLLVYEVPLEGGQIQ